MIEEQYNFILQQSKGLKGDSAYQSIRQDFWHTLDYWIDTLKIKVVQYLKSENLKLDDIVLFNQNQNKALLFLLQSSKDFAKTVEYVTVIAADKIDENWRFYYGVVTFTYGYIPERNTQYLFDELSKFTIGHIIRDGYFKKDTLEIDNDYVDKKWFTKDLPMLYEIFLKD